MKSKRCYHYLFLIAVSQMLLIPAYYNHYPLVNPDTAIYIESGFLPAMPGDRPITYGILVRIMSLNGLSLWLVVFWQALLVTWLIYRICDSSVHIPRVKWITFIIVAILSTCTGLSWVVSQIQPDIFTGVAILCLIVLLMGHERKKTDNLLYVIFFLSVAAHLSHPLLFIAVVLLQFLTYRFYSTGNMGMPARKLYVLLAISVGSIIIMITPLHKSKHIFFMGSLLEKGVLKTYLDEHCADHAYKLCRYKDSLPGDVNKFWWDPNSPLYKIGDWKSVRPEFNNIFQDIFTHKKYLKLYLLASIKQTLRQSVTYNIGDGNQSFDKGSYVHKMISKYFPREVRQFEGSVQNNFPMYEKIANVNRLFSIVLSCSVLLLFGVALMWSRLDTEVHLVVLISLTGGILSITDCAMFGIVNGRYGCKVAWLVPFCVLIAIFSATGRMVLMRAQRNSAAHS